MDYYTKEVTVFGTLDYYSKKVNILTPRVNLSYALITSLYITSCTYLSTYNPIPKLSRIQPYNTSHVETSNPLLKIRNTEPRYATAGYQ